ncbi:oligosaccharide flippase family protein [uncultured Massilia sp.]|uniref:oligosaccharide flippase family protein n=1 Tax=uncultured Massilia sp. TaxID=169973 RepID=UPI0025FB785D|nr:oligosaccharide flippase family protein [uncultured Massilia sp.]
MANLRRSLVINFFSSSGASLLQFFCSILLARMLSPSEIGVFSMTAVFVNVAHMFRDFGVASYVQREPDLTVDKMRSAIGVMLATSWSLALFLFLVSAPLGVWLREPGVVPVMRVLALGFLIVPFGSITHSMLLRELAADKQAVVTAAGTLSYCVSCLGLAALGCGTMSLAWANLINISVCALVYIPFRPKGMPWLPSFRHWRSVVNFGVGTLLTNCVQAVSGAIPDMLLGKLGSARLVGLLSRATSTVQIFSYAAGTTITYGALSYLSQAHHRGESLAPILRRATSLLTGIGWPAFALTAVFGRDLVLALYGSAWIDCVPAIAPLALAAGVTLLFQYAPVALTAMGMAYLGAVPQLVTCIGRLVFGYVLFDGSLVSFAWAVSLATLVGGPVLVYQQTRHLGFGLGAMFGSVAASALVTLVCTGAGMVLHLLLPESLPPLLRLLVALPPLVAVWYASLRATRHELLEEVHRLAGAARMRVLRLVRPAGA